MLLFSIWAIVSGVYGAGYMIFCIRRKNAKQAAGACLLAIIPIVFGVMLKVYSY